MPEELHFTDSRSQAILNAPEAANWVGYHSPYAGLALGIQELNPATQEWEKTEYEYSTPYSILSVSSREGGRELYIAAMEQSGNDWSSVIERWTHAPIQGGYAASMSGGVTPRGVPRGPYAWTVGLTGETFVPHAERNRPRMTRTVLYRGKDYGIIESVAVDPEGRFLLFHSVDPGDLYSIDLRDPSAPVQMELSVSDVPVLVHSRRLGIYDHEALGRFWILRENRHSTDPGPTGSRIVLFDADNDGYSDSVQVYAPTEFVNSAIGDMGSWLDPTDYGWNEG